MTRFIKLAFFTLAIFGLAACSRLQPVQVIHQQVPPAPQTQGTLSASDLRPALVRALVRSKWTIEQDEPNRLLARLDFRGHSAAITLDYVAERYDIRYRDSKELGYQDGKIHKRYNALVKRLDRVIQQEIRIAQNLGPTTTPQ